jgi:hypothetical protein
VNAADIDDAADQLEGRVGVVVLEGTVTPDEPPNMSDAATTVATRVT